MQNVRMRTNRCSAALKPRCNLLCQVLSEMQIAISHELEGVVTHQCRSGPSLFKSVDPNNLIIRDMMWSRQDRRSANIDGAKFNIVVLFR